MKKIKNIFIQGAIDSSFVSKCIAKHTKKWSIGGHSIFLGQVREDVIQQNKVQAIDFTAYQEMAMEKTNQIREQIIGKYGLTCAHIYHSLGKIKVGEICLFVFTSAPHRKEAIKACDEMVDRIKKEVPIWGKEILENETYQWKENQ